MQIAPLFPSPAKAGAQLERFQRASAAANQLIVPNWAPAFAGEGAQT